MRTAPWLRLACLATLGIGAGGFWTEAIATTFDSQAVNPSSFVTLAAPIGTTSHQLLILEQLNNSRPCWRENGDRTTVDPLLLNFDFTGICGRSTDSNGYSVRIGDEDLGWRYSLRLVERQGNLVLVAASNTDRSSPELEVGRTQGRSGGFLKINLNPGWRLTKRVYNGQPLGHVYLTNDQSLPTLIAAANASAPQPSLPVRPPSPSPSLPTPSLPAPSLPRPPQTTPPGNLSPSPSLPPVVVAPTPTTPGTTPPPLFSGPPPSSSNNLASQLGFSYRVVVPASTLALQDRVRAASPGAFRTVIDGQVVMQTGLFRTQQDAVAQQQQLSQQNLQARVVSVAASVPQPPPAAPPRPSTPTNNLPQVPRGRLTAVIDAGHGGRDPGAVGIGGLREKDINLAISRQVADILERQGVQTVLTRSDDREIDLAPRVQIAERANANLFVSIHSNAISLSRPDVNGAETYYSSSTGRALAQSIQSSIVQSTGMNDRGVRTANFYVLRNTSMPSVLVEVGFVTGRDDAARLRDPAFQTRMAEAIARGILNYAQRG